MSDDQEETDWMDWVKNVNKGKAFRDPITGKFVYVDIPARGLLEEYIEKRPDKLREIQEAILIVHGIEMMSDEKNIIKANVNYPHGCSDIVGSCYECLFGRFCGTIREQLPYIHGTRFSRN